MTLSVVVIPLLFAAIHRVTTETSWRGYVEASLAAALLVLAHPLSALYYAPFLGFWAVLCLVLMGRGKRWRAVLILAASAVTGALATSFYWLPAQLESSARQSIDLAVALQEYVRELKPIGQVVGVSLTTIFRWKETVPIFSAAVLVLPAIALIAFALTLRRRDRDAKIHFIFFAISAAAAMLAMTTWALPLWERFAPVAYLQFPWRWLGPLALFTALIIGGSLSVATPGRFDKWYCMAVGFVLGFLVITSLANAPDAPAQMPTVGIYRLAPGDFETPGLLRDFEHTEEDYIDTRGCWIWDDRLVPSTSFFSDCPRFLDVMLRDVPVRSALPAVAAQVVPTAAGPDVLAARVSSPTPWQLSLHAYWIPGWSATIDGKPARTAPTDAIGVVGLAVPAGEHQVRLAFGPTPVRVAAIVVSLLALVAWLVLAWWWRRRLAAVVTLALLIIVGLVGGQALHAPAAPAVQPLDVNLGSKIGLQGFALDKSGDTLAVHLVWLAREPMEESYKVFIHVIDDQGKLLAQVDSRPQGYASNTNRWIPGQMVADRFEVRVAP